MIQFIVKLWHNNSTDLTERECSLEHNDRRGYGGCVEFCFDQKLYVYIIVLGCVLI